MSPSTPSAPPPGRSSNDSAARPFADAEVRLTEEEQRLVEPQRPSFFRRVTGRGEPERRRPPRPKPSQADLDEATVAPGGHALRWPWMLGAVLGLLSVIQVWNMGSAPWWRDDEGTYTAQAWAVLNEDRLTHYTYFYDHPPTGWLTLAGWAWLTGAFDRVSAVAAGRELAALATIACLPLLYIVARRMGLRRGYALGAVVLFTLSPVALEHHRVLWLDNVAMPMFLGALALALGRGRHLLRLLAVGVLFGVACLTKETFLLLAPVLVVAALMTIPTDRRRWPLIAMSLGTAVTLAMYPLYALRRGELFRGAGVSLEDGIRFQLIERAGSGYALNPGSDANEVLRSWLTLDPWLLSLGVLAIPLALSSARLRPAAIGLAILTIALFARSGYLPSPFVVAMLPFAALCVAGGLQVLMEAGEERSPRNRVLMAAAVIVGLIAVPGWVAHDYRLLTEDQAQGATGARDWIIQNADRDAAIITDDTLWVDLVESGFDRDRVIWFYKLDLDPAVKARFPGGYRDIDYVISSPPVRWSSGGLPTVSDALRESETVSRFSGVSGDYEVRKVGSRSPE